MAPAPSSALEPSSGGFPVGGLVAPCACCPCVLRGVCGFPARGGFATCLLLTGAPGFGSFSFSSAPLFLSLCSSLIQPSSLWGLFLVGCGVCLWCLQPSSCASLSFFVRRLFVSLRFLGGWRPVAALSRFRCGVQLFCFPWRPPSPFFRLCPGHWVVFLALSFACCLVPVRRVFTVPCGFGVELPLPSMRALRSASLRPLGCSTVSCLLSRRCCLSSTLVFSVPLPVGSSWAPPSSSAGVVSSASSSCLRGPLGFLLLLSTHDLPLVSVS